MRLLKTSRKRISYIPVSIESWNKKQEEFDCFCDQLQALSQVMTGLISWSICLSWQHPQFILNSKFHQYAHIFSLALCNPDNKSVLSLPSHSRPSLLHLFKKQSLKLEHYLHYQDLLIFSFFFFHWNTKQLLHQCRCVWELWEPSILIPDYTHTSQFQFQWLKVMWMAKSNR